MSPPRRFGTEVVARLLGLRLDHPVGQDELELQPQQTATRAEAAYSLAQILGFGGGHDGWGPQDRRSSAATPAADFASSWQVEQAKAAAAEFQLPELTPWQRRIVATAFSYVGYPYVWGGTGESSLGFDCSGFIWRVYKLTSYPDEAGLADVLHGRTTMEMSGEVPRAQRIGAAKLAAGDCSSAAGHGRSRRRSTTRRSTSETAGSSSPRRTASHSPPSRVGTGRRSPGAGGHSPKPAWHNAPLFVTMPAWGESPSSHSRSPA